MKQLFIGLAIGAGFTTALFLMTKSETSNGLLARIPTPLTASMPYVETSKPTLPYAVPTSKALTSPTTQSLSHVDAAQPKQKIEDVPGTATKKAGSTDLTKFVPALFSGSVEGFPRLEEKTQKFLESAQLLVSMNQPEAAIEELEAAIKDDPSNGYYAVELAIMHSELTKNLRRSEEILTDHLRRNPESKMVAAAYADFLSQHGRESEATPYYTRAAAGNATIESLSQYGHHLMRTNRPDKAMDAYQRALDKSQGDFEQKLSRRESTLVADQEVGNKAVDLARAAKQTGNMAEYRRATVLAVSHLKADDPQLQILRNADP